MKVVVANDHAGYPLKLAVVQHLEQAGHDVVDLGSHSTEPVDYPPICAGCARRVVAGDADRGIVIGGSGQGEALAANKVRGARVVAEELALDIVDVFLSTGFDGGRHQQRIAEITAIEDEEAAKG